EGPEVRGRDSGRPGCCTTGPCPPPRRCPVRGERHRGALSLTAVHVRQGTPDRGEAVPTAPPALRAHSTPSRCLPCHGLAHYHSFRVCSIALTRTNQSVYVHIIHILDGPNADEARRTAQGTRSAD